MMRRGRNISRDQRGAAALEFALVTPALILLIIGIAQLGILFMANAGLRNAVAEGARYATIFPRPSEAQIRTRVSSSRFGLTPANLTVSPVTYGVADGANYAIVSASYTVQPDFVFFTLPPITLTESRRAFIHPAT